MRFQRLFSLRLSDPTPLFRTVSSFHPQHVGLVKFRPMVGYELKPYVISFARGLATIPPESPLESESKQLLTSKQDLFEKSLKANSFSHKRNYRRWVGYCLVAGLSFIAGIAFLHISSTHESSLRDIVLMLKEGKIKEALDILLKRVKQDPVLWNGLQKLQQGHWEEAESILDNYFQGKPEAYYYWIVKGIFFGSVNNAKRELSCYEQAIALQPNLPEAYFCRGKLLLAKSGKYDAAISDFDEVLKHHPTDKFTLFNKGSALFEKGDYDAALIYYDEVLKCDPGYLPAYHNKGLAFFKKGDYKNAVASYDMVLKNKRDDVSAYVNKSIVLIETGRYDDAIVSCNEALKYDSRDIEANINKGIALARKGDNDAAILCYNQALECNSNHVAANFNKGIALFNKGNNDAAIVNFNQVLKYDSEHIGAYLNRGNVFFKKNLYDDAINSYGEVLKRNPNHVAANLNKSLALFEKGAYEAVVTVCNELLKNNPDCADAYCIKGNALLKKGDINAAITSYEKALKQKSDYRAVQINMKIALAAKKEGNFSTLSGTLKKSVPGMA